MKEGILVLAYAGCTTCKNAQKWLDARGTKYVVRPIVERPPTAAELKKWIPMSGLGVRKWLNTSGQSYRAIGKDAIDRATDAELVAMLANDGKLVKRPVVVAGERVLVGFKADAYEAALQT